jgi:hypothetical protein
MARAERTKVARYMLLAGCACLVVVVLMHVAERLSIFPSMGWGLPDSPGHYLNLFSAVAGVGLLVIGLVVRQI